MVLIACLGKVNIERNNLPGVDDLLVPFGGTKQGANLIVYPLLSPDTSSLLILRPQIKQGVERGAVISETGIAVKALHLDVV